MNMRSDFRRPFKAQNSCNHGGTSYYGFVQFREESHEDQKTCLRHVRGSRSRCIRDRFGDPKRSGQEEEESGSCTAASSNIAGAVAHVLGSPLCTGLCEEG